MEEWFNKYDRYTNGNEDIRNDMDGKRLRESTRSKISTGYRRSYYYISFYIRSIRKFFPYLKAFIRQEPYVDYEYINRDSDRHVAGIVRSFIEQSHLFDPQTKQITTNEQINFPGDERKYWVDLYESSRRYEEQRYYKDKPGRHPEPNHGERDKDWSRISQSIVDYGRSMWI